MFLICQKALPEESLHNYRKRRKSIFIKVNVIQNIFQLEDFLFRQGKTLCHGRMVRIPGPEVKLFSPVIPARIGKLFFPAIGGFREVS